jgi:hypothetical protein
VDQWTSGTVCECSEIAGSAQGSPPAADYVGCEAGRRTCSERETRREEMCEIKWDYHNIESYVGVLFLLEVNYCFDRVIIAQFCGSLPASVYDHE